MHETEERIFEEIRSDHGNKRWLAWEKLFIEFPLPGLPPGVAASKMLRAEIESKIRRSEVEAGKSCLE